MNLTNLRNAYQKRKFNSVIVANNSEIKTLIQQICDERLGNYEETNKQRIMLHVKNW